MELLAFADGCRRASAARITAIVPYFGYARSDKRHGRREPIGARLVADLLQTAGIDHVMTIDLHSSQIEGFFRIPVDSLSAVCGLCDVIKTILPPGAVVVSPDVGRLKMATEYAQRLNTSVVLLHKTRAAGPETRVTHLVGDVQPLVPRRGRLDFDWRHNCRSGRETPPGRGAARHLCRGDSRPAADWRTREALVRTDRRSLHKRQHRAAGRALVRRPYRVGRAAHRRGNPANHLRPTCRRSGLSCPLPTVLSTVMASGSRR